MTPDRPVPKRRVTGTLNRNRLWILYSTIGLLAIHMYLWYGLGYHAIGKFSFSGFASLLVGHINTAAVFCVGIFLGLLLSGRLFCGYICKLSAFQEATEWVYRRIGFKPTLLHTRARTVRIFIWVPYLLPILYTWRDVGLSTAYTDLGRVEPWTSDLPQTVGMTLLYFGTITFLLTGLFGRRAFCRLVCMFAMFFQLFDRLPWVAGIRQRGRCIACDRCDAACPMGIPVKNQVLRTAKVTDPECIRCMVCIDTCPVKALTFAREPTVEPQRPELAEEVRQSAFPLWADVVLGMLAVVCGVWAATRLTGFHVFLGASGGLAGGLLLIRPFLTPRRLA